MPVRLAIAASRSLEVVDLGDADARAAARRLDEHRAARGRATVGREPARRRATTTYGGDRQAGGGEQLLHVVLVHGRGARRSTPEPT